MKHTRSLACVAAMLVGALAPPVHAATERTPDSAVAALDVGKPPAAGLYDAMLCVAVGAEAARCGPVLFDVFANGRADVQIDDVIYRLQPAAGDQLGVSLFHGNVQLDGFFVHHKWSGKTLHFADPEKGTRYELQVGTRRFAPQ